MSKRYHLKLRALPLLVGAAFAATTSSNALADNRFETQGSALEGEGSFGSGTVTVHHNLLQDQYDDLVDMITAVRTDLEAELDITRTALEGDIERLDDLVNSAQERADQAWSHAQDAHTHFTTVTNQLKTQLSNAEGRISDNASEIIDKFSQAMTAIANNAQDISDNTSLINTKANQSYAEWNRDRANAAYITANNAVNDAKAAYDKALQAYNHAAEAHKELVTLTNQVEEAKALAIKLAEEAVPSGAYAYFGESNCPSGWVPANGDNGTRNLQGQFIRSWNHGSGIDSGRSLGSFQSDAQQPIKGHFSSRSVYSPHHSAGPVRPMIFHEGGPFTSRLATDVLYGLSTVTNGQPSQIVSFDSSRVVRTATENRPTNVALLACMKQ